jgi:hypothetical protein
MFEGSGGKSLLIMVFPRLLLACSRAPALAAIIHPAWLHEHTASNATSSTAGFDVLSGCLRAKEAGRGAATFGSYKQWPAIQYIVEFVRFDARNGMNQSRADGYRRRVVTETCPV